MARRKKQPKIKLSEDDFVKQYLSLSKKARREMRLSTGTKLDDFLMGDLKIKDGDSKKLKRFDFARLVRIMFFYNVKNETKYKVMIKKHRLPRLSKINEIFGCFDNLLKTVWGEEGFKEIIQNRAKIRERILKERTIKIISPERLLALVNQYNLYEKVNYKYACVKYPDIIPNLVYVQDNFGSFERMIYIAKRNVVTGVAEMYMAFRKRYGKFPTMLECEKIGLHKIKFLMDIYETKEKLDEFFEQMYNQSKKVDFLHEVKTKYEKQATTLKKSSNETGI